MDGRTDGQTDGWMDGHHVWHTDTLADTEPDQDYVNTWLSAVVSKGLIYIFSLSLTFSTVIQKKKNQNPAFFQQQINSFTPLGEIQFFIGITKAIQNTEIAFNGIFSLKS